MYCTQFLGHTFRLRSIDAARTVAGRNLSPLASVFGAEQPVKVVHNVSFERRVLAAGGLALYGVVDTRVESKRISGLLTTTESSS